MQQYLVIVKQLPRLQKALLLFALLMIMALINGLMFPMMLPLNIAKLAAHICYNLLLVHIMETPVLLENALTVIQEMFALLITTLEMMILLTIYMELAKHRL